MAQLSLAELTEPITVERSQCAKALSLPTMHYHLFYEIYVLVKGKRRYFIGDKIYDVYPGNIVVIPRAEVHRTSPIDMEGFDRFVVYFNRTTAERLIDTVGEAGFADLFSAGCISLPKQISDKIIDYLTIMLRESEQNDKYSLPVMKNLLESILILAMRYRKIKECEEKEGADKIQEAAKYINQNFKSQITLKDAAAFAYMEKTYFSKKFKQLTGFGFKEYLTLIRIREAENLLRTTSMTVSEISETCGFSGSNYFGDAFKKEKGVSPSEFRKSILKK